MKKLAVLALSAVLCFGFVACGDDDDIVFTEDPSSVLKVNNLDNQRLVLYAAKSGAVGAEAGTVLGGVGSGATGWGVPKVDSTMQMFILNVVTYKQYSENPSNPRISSSLLVYVDNTPATYPISAGIMGNGRIQYYNETSNYVEIRGGEADYGNPSWYSPAYTVLRPNESKRVWFPDGDYELFPVLKYERRQGGVIIGVGEKFLTTKVRLYSFHKNSRVLEERIDSGLASAAQDTVAYLSVKNSSTYGARMVDGGSYVENSLGRTVVGTGDQMEYWIQMPTVGAGQNIQIGETTTGNYTFSAGSQGVIAQMDPELVFTYHRGKMYAITIPPTAAPGNIATVVPVETTLSAE